MPKIKNIIIFTTIFAVLVLGYIFFIQKSTPKENLTGSSNLQTTSATSKIVQENNNLKDSSLITNNFLSLLLSVKSIKLDDTIFSNKSFNDLHDFSILLVPTFDEGRLNPFAPIGYEASILTEETPDLPE